MACSCCHMVFNLFVNCILNSLQLVSLPQVQVEFVMAYTQEPIEMNMYIELPTGIKNKHDDRKSRVLNLLANIYGQKQSGRFWNKHLTDKLIKWGFVKSQVDECVFHHGGSTIFTCYLNDALVLGTSNS